MRPRVIVIGAGAAGMMAAGTAGENGCDVILNFGVTGALEEDLQVDDLFVVEKVCHYDFDTSAIDAVKKGLQQELGFDIRILDYTEHALNSGSEAQAAAYVQMQDNVTGRTTFGVGISSNITRASIRAMVLVQDPLHIPVIFRFGIVQ